MSSITGSVGRGGNNRPDDVRLIQDLLNNSAYPPVPALAVDGLMGPRTIAAIENFQKSAVKMANPDGRVDPGGKTFNALAGNPAPPRGNGKLPEPRGSVPLNGVDFQRAALALSCEVACIQAVNEVESGGSGFLASGRPKILFEAQWFSRLTRNAYDASHPGISSPSWNQKLYKGGEKEYDRLQEALALDHSAALQSASWGRFQILGVNFQKAGFVTVDAYVEAHYESEGRQLDAFVAFLKNSGLDAPLRDRRWADFAKGYNGPGYAQNEYDRKLQAAYRKFAGKG
jgi:peptidoglycan hydrolase-like protein with peptidoglycan-binding domain